MQQAVELIDPAESSSRQMPEAIISRLPPALTILAICVGILLRWVQLGARSLWFDEGYTAWVISLKPAEIIRMIRADTAPPLYYLILREWTQMFGRSEAAMRSLSAVFATLTLPVFFLLARRVLKKPWAVTAAVWIFSLSYMQVDYAHEARFYSMLALLGAMDLYLVLLACEKWTVSRIVCLILAWTLSLYTNNMMAVYLAFLGIGWLILPGERPLRRRVIDLLIVTAVSGLAFAPWVPTMLAQSRAMQGHFWADVPDFYSLARAISVLAGVHEQTIFPRGLAGMVGIDAALILCIELTLWTPARRIAMALAIFSLGPILFIYAYSHMAQSIFMERAFMPSGVIFPLLAALPLALPRSRWLQIPARLTLLIFLLLCVHSLNGQRLGEHDEDWRNAMRFIVASPAKHRVVIFVANEGEMLYDYYVRHGDYTPRSDMCGLPWDYFSIDPPRTMGRIVSERDLHSLRKVLDKAEFDELVLVVSHSWYTDKSLLALSLLKSSLPLREQRVITHIGVFRFGTAGKTTASH